MKKRDLYVLAVLYRADNTKLDSATISREYEKLADKVLPMMSVGNLMMELEKKRYVTADTAGGVSRTIRYGLKNRTQIPELLKEAGLEELLINNQKKET